MPYSNASASMVTRHRWQRHQFIDRLVAARKLSCCSTAALLTSGVASWGVNVGSPPQFRTLANGDPPAINRQSATVVLGPSGPAANDPIADVDLVRGLGAAGFVSGTIEPLAFAEAQRACCPGPNSPFSAFWLHLF